MNSGKVSHRDHQSGPPQGTRARSRAGSIAPAPTPDKLDAFFGQRGIEALGPGRPNSTAHPREAFPGVRLSQAKSLPQLLSASHQHGCSRKPNPGDFPSGANKEEHVPLHGSARTLTKGCAAPRKSAPEPWILRLAHEPLQHAVPPSSANLTHLAALVGTGRLPEWFDAPQHTRQPSRSSQYPALSPGSRARLRKP